jgi:hypothetical protein
MVERVGFEQYSYLSTGAAPSDRDRAVSLNRAEVVGSNPTGPFLTVRELQH